ncbi:hypothetical protein ACJ2A9_21380 [Anaerobacillus sp. MEB173]|uniref:hypothetical protein n=1 Tax=Anaerobacillus sp. MEB173 TaxID=3383345 RepID=UPI003F9260B7
MGQAKNWSQEELDYLQNKWGVISIKAISNQLGRSVNAIKLKARKLGLGDASLHYDGITVSQLCNVLNVSYSYTMKVWIEKHNLPIKHKIFAEKSKVKVIKYDDFWKWAEANKQMINFAKLEPLSLGPEPSWVEEKRNADLIDVQRKKQRSWSTEDEQTLKGMISAFSYTYADIANRLNRTEGAVKRRIQELGLKGRPVQRNNHTKYTDEEVKLLIEMYHKGYGFNTIANKLGKSELGVRGKLERMGYRFKNKVPVKVG